MSATQTPSNFKVKLLPVTAQPYGIQGDTKTGMSDASSICARCAVVYSTCCRTDPTGCDNCFPLSEAEKQRLLPYAERMGIHAAEEEENTERFHDLLRLLFPDRPGILANAYPLGGVHYRLPLSEDGSCLFLGEVGCILPRSARPWYCQLFPIWIREGYFVSLKMETCLITHEIRKINDVFAAIGLSKETAKEYYRALCRDWGMETDDHA